MKQLLDRKLCLPGRHVPSLRLGAFCLKRSSPKDRFESTAMDPVALVVIVLDDSGLIILP